MCLGVPGEIVELPPDQPDMAEVEVSGVRRTINIALLDDEEEERLAPGDWVLIHVGFALSKLDEQEAQATLDYLRAFGETYGDELATPRASPTE